jgi:hypothetical protein
MSRIGVVTILIPEASFWPGRPRASMRHSRCCGRRAARDHSKRACVGCIASFSVGDKADSGADRRGRAGTSPAIVTKRHLMVVQSTSELGFLEMRRNVFVWHFVVSSPQKERLLYLGQCPVPCRRVTLLTSSSVQALPPPVEAALRCLGPDSLCLSFRGEAGH